MMKSNFDKEEDCNKASKAVFHWREEKGLFLEVLGVERCRKDETKNV